MEIEAVRAEATSRTESGPGGRVIRLVHLLAQVRKRFLPDAFLEPSVERQFLDEFRLAGLQSVATACLVGIVVYVVFGALEIAYGVSTLAATLRRIVAISLLAAMVLLVLRAPSRVLDAYTTLIGSFGCIAIIGMVSVMRLLRDNAAETLINPVPVLAILVLYGFGRLPIGVAVLVGTIGSVFSMFGSRLTNMHEPAIRTAIYLLVANGLGVLLARSIEVRERHLFNQRRQIEEAHAQLESRTRVAEKASSEKTRLMAAVSHDLRQPMLSATIHAEVLVQKLDSGKLQEARRQASHVLESVKALGDTLEHLLLAARYHAGTEPVNKSWVSVNSVLARIEDLFRVETEEKGLELRVRYPRDDVFVRTDEQVLLRVLSNLVSNALKFTEPKQQRCMGIVVRCFHDRRRCVICVADTGRGIETEFLHRVWEPFFRANVVEEGRHSGDGLGLYLVRQSLLKLESHSIAMRSRVGHGTRVALTIADVRCGGQILKGEDTLRAALSGEMVGGLKGMRVVLIEDDFEVRSALEAQFDTWGVACLSGDRLSKVLADKQLDRGPVDAIVADFHLRYEVNGVEAILQIRERIGQCVPAVLVTAEIDAYELLASLPARTTLLAKPFDGIDMASALNHAGS